MKVLNFNRCHQFDYITNKCSNFYTGTTSRAHSRIKKYADASRASCSCWGLLRVVIRVGGGGGLSGIFVHVGKAVILWGRIYVLQ